LLSFGFFRFLDFLPQEFGQVFYAGAGDSGDWVDFFSQFLLQFFYYFAIRVEVDFV